MKNFFFGMLAATACTALLGLVLTHVNPIQASNTGPIPQSVWQQMQQGDGNGTANQQPGDNSRWGWLGLLGLAGLVGLRRPTYTIVRQHKDTKDGTVRRLVLINEA